MDIPKELADFTLTAGIGDYDQRKACVMSLAVAMDRLRKGEPIGEATDDVHCVCPVLRRLVIARNDGPWESDEARTAWGLAMAPRLLDTRRDETETVRRGYRCADVAVRVIAAQALRSAGLVDWAVKLDALDPIIDKKSARAAAYAAASAADAARTARAAAYAADAAADAADAARAAAYAAADAARTARAAAYAADAAADAARAARAAAYAAAYAARAAYAADAAYAARAAAYAAAYAAYAARVAADAAARAARAARAASAADDASWGAIDGLINEFANPVEAKCE